MTTLATLNESIAPTTYPEPTAAERCDRCGAQAYFRILKEAMERFLFCAHHGRHHSPALMDTGHIVLDYTYMLEPIVSEPEE